MFDIIKKALPYLNDSLSISMDRLISSIVKGYIPLPKQLEQAVFSRLTNLKGQSKFKKKVKSQTSIFDIFSTFIIDHEKSSDEDEAFELESVSQVFELERNQQT